jgi:hypothetical protein
MSIRTAISAFAHRGARRGTAATFVAYSGVLTLALLLLSAWITPAAKQSDLEMLALYLQSRPPFHPNLDPSLWTTLALADVFAVWTLALAGFVLAPAMVAAAVANERRAGTLDQLRTTPLSALGLGCGLIVGVPARLYLLCAGPLALHVVASLSGALPLGACLQTLVILAAGAALSCVFGLLVALAPRQESGGAFAALGVAGVLGGFGLLTLLFPNDRHMVAWSFLHPGGALDAAMLAPATLWRRMIVGPWNGHFDSPSYVSTLGLIPVLSVALSLVGAALGLRAACRKLAAPQLPLFSKPLAVALFAFATVALVPPAWLYDASFDFDASAAYGFSLFMLPVVVVLGLFASPSAEAWAVSVRRGGGLGWTADDAPAHRAVWLMEALWAACLVTLVSRHWMHPMSGDETVALAWTVLLALTLPVYFLFASTRYATAPARWAFGVAVAAHLICQMIAIGIVRNRDVRGFVGTFVTLAGIAALAVPAWTIWRQRVLRNRILAR